MMAFDEFDVLLRQVQADLASKNLPTDAGWRPFDEWRATEDQLEQVQAELNVKLPQQYRRFMKSYGGGAFLYLDLLSVVAPNHRAEDLLEANRSPWSHDGFIAIAPVGTGDWWGSSMTPESVAMRSGSSITKTARYAWTAMTFWTS